jgi:hypothetical protein
MDMYDNAAKEFVFLFGIPLVLAVCSGLYLLNAYILWRIGRKCGVGTFGLYCIPFYNLVLMCRWIGLSEWASVWFVIPLLLGAGIYIWPQQSPAVVLFLLTVGALYLAFLVYFWGNFWGNVARRLGKGFWLYGLTSLLFGISVLFLAFDDSAAGEDDSGKAAGRAKSVFSLFCIAGEQAQRTIPVPQEGLYIGRNPAKANFVLHSNQISNVHVRVWPDPSGSGLWVKDWNSLNGTFYKEGRGDYRAKGGEWIPVRGQVLLNQGAHLRLGMEVAEFEVNIS